MGKGTSVGESINLHFSSFSIRWYMQLYLEMEPALFNHPGKIFISFSK